MITIIKEVNDFYLKDELWSGALNTINTIIENNKSQELMHLLEDLFPEPIDVAKVNDLLWFEPEFIYEELNIEVDD